MRRHLSGTDIKIRMLDGSVWVRVIGCGIRRILHKTKQYTQIMWDSGRCQPIKTYHVARSKTHLGEEHSARHKIQILARILLKNICCVRQVRTIECFANDRQQIDSCTFGAARVMSCIVCHLPQNTLELLFVLSPSKKNREGFPL